MILALLLAQASVATAVARPRCRWQEGQVVRFGPARDCRPWHPPRRRTGVWLYEFEGSRFVEGARTLAEALAAPTFGAGVRWLSVDERSRLLSGCRPALGQAYLIDFVGHDAAPRGEGETYFSGGYGHMGAWKGEVLVDEVKAVRDLGPLPGAQVRAAGPTPTCTSSSQLR